MLKDLADALFLYLAPILSFVGPLLVTLSYVSPMAKIGNWPPLVVIKPSSSTLYPSGDVDGPSVFIGLLRFCSRADNFKQITCERRRMNPHYDLGDVLPKAAASMFDSVVATPYLIVVGLSLLWLFFGFFALFAFCIKWGDRVFGPQFTRKLDRPLAQRICTWSGLAGFVLGVSSFGVVRIWFGKAVVDFNKSIEVNGDVQLIAELSSGFTMAWAGYALDAVPLICALTKIHITIQ